MDTRHLDSYKVLLSILLLINTCFSSVTGLRLGRLAGEKVGIGKENEFFLMAQIGVLMGKTEVVRMETMKVASINVERRFQQFSLTLIGRVWNRDSKTWTL